MTLFYKTEFPVFDPCLLCEKVITHQQRCIIVYEEDTKFYYPFCDSCTTIVMMDEYTEIETKKALYCESKNRPEPP
jgi:hypothetical protein